MVGAGAVGTSYSVHLARQGQTVSLLARGSRLETLRTKGVWLHYALTHRRVTAPIRVISELPDRGDLDLAIVATRFTQFRDLLPSLVGVNRRVPILFLGNNPLDLDSLAAAFGQRALLVGFPATGGVCLGDHVRSLSLSLGTTVIGESDGSQSFRLQQALSVLRQASLRVESRRDMSLWLKTQAVMLAVLGSAVSKYRGSLRRMCMEPTATRLYLSALREAFEVLEAAGIPVTPRSQWRVFARSPRGQLESTRLASLISGTTFSVDHFAAQKSDEIAAVYGLLAALAEQTGVETPALSLLRTFVPA